MRNNDIFIRAAKALLADHSSIYYVDAQTDGFFRFSLSDGCDEQEGGDFFGVMLRDAERDVYEEDRSAFTELMQKEKLLAAVKDGGMKQFEYRRMIGGEPVWHTIRVMRETDGGGGDDRIIIGIVNIDEQVRERRKAEQLLEEREAFDRIADSLASNYDVINCIDRDSFIRRNRHNSRDFVRS